MDLSPILKHSLSLSCVAETGRWDTEDSRAPYFPGPPLALGPPEHMLGIPRVGDLKPGHDSASDWLDEVSHDTTWECLCFWVSVLHLWHDYWGLWFSLGQWG